MAKLAHGQNSVIYDTGKIFSAGLRHKPSSNLPLKSQEAYLWTLQVWDQNDQPSETTIFPFFTGLVASQDNQAKWIASTPVRNDKFQDLGGQWRTVDNAKPVPEFERAFEIAEKPILAHLVIAGVGQYELLLDGHRVSPDAMNGHWTNFDKRVLYDSYDLSDLLKPGSHRLSVALGNGFFNVEAIKGRYAKLNASFGAPCLWLQLRLVFHDGQEKFIVSNEEWSARDSGTILSSIYAGEDFDARRQEPWRISSVVDGPSGRLETSKFVPMKVQSRLTAAKVTVPEASIQVFDFAVNHSGRPALRLKNTLAGEKISLYPTELLDERGLMDTKSMAAPAKAIAFQYICQGAAEEIWSPAFTYTGYRYLQAEGATHRIASIESLFMYNDLPMVGEFQSSDKNIEKIHGLIRQALRCNSASVITDCPHREKLGWLEQIYLNADTALMNMDALTVYEKMTSDIRDSQTQTGMVPSIAPEYVHFIENDGTDSPFRDSPEWAAALILASWYVYRVYGDIGILEENYEAMKAYVAYVETRLGADGLLDYGLGDWYDIGPGTAGPAQLTSRKMTGTGTLVFELGILSEIARCLGKPDGLIYARKKENLILSMQKALFDPNTSRFDTGSQCAQAMAIVIGLLPEGYKAKALEVLVDDIHSRNDHVTAGDIGFHYVVRALSDNGRGDVLHAMLSRPDKPSYLQQIANGATALTEAWDGDRHSSQNHFMLGHAEIWFWQGLGGIRIDHSAEIPVTIAPQNVAGIEACSATYHSVSGTIRSGLSKRGNIISIIAEIPVGLTAIVHIPTSKKIEESGRPLEAENGIASIDEVGEETLVTVGSGNYQFTCYV